MTERVIRVILDPSGVAGGSAQVNRALGGIERQTRLLQTSLRTLGRLAGIFVGTLGAREVLNLTSTYQALQNRIRTVVDSEEALIRTQERLTGISRETRSDLEATVGLYQRASIAAGELGASNEELFRLVEITGKALAVQGGATQEASGALRQLSQSFSSGIVRGEEFNSILEGAFPLAQAAARGLDEAGGSVGRLRTLVIEGRVTSQEFFRAILEGSEGIEQQFAKTEVTIGQAGQVLRNQLLVSVGRLNDFTGASERLSELIIGIAEGMGDLTDAFTGTLDPTDELTSGMQKFATGTIIAAAAVETLFDLLKTPGGLFTDIGEALGGTGAALTRFSAFGFRGPGGSAEKRIQALREGAGIMREVWADAFDDTEESGRDFLESFAERAESVSERISQIFLESFRDPPSIPGGGDDDPLGGGGGGVDEDVLEKQREFLEGLQRQTAELAIEAALLDESEAAIIRYNSALDAAALGNDEFQREAQLATDALVAQLEAVERSRARQADAELVSGLEDELELLRLADRERAIEIELRKLSAEATDEQRAAVEELAGAVFDEMEAQRRRADFLEAIAEQGARNIQNVFADFLFDPFEDGLEGMARNFANTLHRMASDALAAQIFESLFASAGEGSTLAGFFTSIFGGGRQHGGGVRPDRAYIVGEGGPGARPEVFSPPTSGTIFPNNQASVAPPQVTVPVTLVNVTDPRETVAAMDSADGDRVILNSLSRHRRAVQEIIR